MPDQTRYRIDEVIGTNKARKYEDDTAKMFDKWLKDCPVVYYLSEPLKGDEKIVQFTFEKNRRRK